VQATRGTSTPAARVGGQPARRAARACRILLAVAAAACTRRPTGPGVEFQVTHVDEVEAMGVQGSGLDDAPAELATVNVEGGAVRVSGLIFVPDRCDRVGARIVEERRSLRLAIHAWLSSGHDGACASEGRVRVMQYSAVLSRMAPGSYRLRVVNGYSGLRAGDPATARWPDRIAYDHPLTLP
jgi:hypothetical protein